MRIGPYRFFFYSNEGTNRHMCMSKPEMLKPSSGYSQSRSQLTTDSP